MRRVPLGASGFAPALAAAVLALRAGSAAACGTCGAGDPSLTAAGTEQPFAGRQRATLELSYRTDRIGRDGFDRLDIREARATTTLAYAVNAQLFALLSVPTVYRRVQEVNLAVHEQWSLGDIEARGKWFFFRDRPFQPRFLAALQLGFKFPTAPFRTGTTAPPWPLEAQTGTGSWDLLAGPALAVFAAPVSFYLSAQWAEPLYSRRELHPGRAVRSTLAGQYQFASWVALRVAHDTRLEARTRETLGTDPNSGGFVAYAGGDVLLSLHPNWLLSLGARLPWFQGMHGAHREGPIFAVALTLDR
ncbi:MAG TPA: hypothetical protein VFQ61_26060 [Polyangiaceae bacterium]|nr:hypothetical protein [Polyangiaceae bacterium]